MNSTKFTNIVFSAGIIVFIVMGIVSLQLNYEAIQNQNDILEGQNKNAESHQIIQNNSSQYFREQVKIILEEIEENEILINQSK